MLSQRKRCRESLLQRVDTERLEPPRLGAEPRRRGQTLKRRPAPESQRRRHGIRGSGRVAVAQRGSRLGEQLFELDRIDVRLLERVPVRRADDRLRSECGAQARDVVVHRVSRSGREVIPPQAVDELVDRDHTALPERKQHKQGLTLGAGHVRGRPARDNLERAENPDFKQLAHWTVWCRLQRRVSHARSRA